MGSVAKNSSRKPPQSTVVTLPKCTLKYALALSDPFNPAARGACIPMTGAPSMKTHAFTRLDIGVSSAGNGFILLCPSTASDAPFGFYSTSSFAGTNANPLTANNTLNTGVATFKLNQPFSISQLNGSPNTGGIAPASARIVSYGVRIQYTGKTTDQAGLIYCFQDPGHISVSSMGASALGAQGHTNIEAVTRKPCCLVGHAVSQDELNYSLNTTSAANTIYPYSNYVNTFNSVYQNNTSASTYLAASASGVDYYMGAPSGIIWISGAASGATFHVEVICHLEYTGGPASSMESKVDSDPQGTLKVLTAAKTLPIAKLNRPRTDPWELMYEGLKTVWNDSKQYVIPAAITAVSSML